MKIVLLILFLIISTFSHGQMQQDEKNDFLCSSETEFVDGQKVLTEVDTRPVYKGGMKELYETLAKELSTPQSDEPNKIYMSFIIDTKGDLRDICIKRRTDNGDEIYTLEADATRGLQKLNKWTPGKHHGKIVPVRMTLPMIVDYKK